jgi:hypothetical protein
MGKCNETRSCVAFNAVLPYTPLREQVELLSVGSAPNPSDAAIPGRAVGFALADRSSQSKSPAVAAHGDNNLIREDCQNTALNGFDAGSACF